MNGLAKERKWYDGVLPGIKERCLRRFVLEGSRVNSRTAQITLAIVFSALLIASRYITLPMFLPPLRGVDMSAIFYSSALLLLPYRYVWIFLGILTFTSVFPIPAFFGWVVGLHIFYFLGRLMTLERARFFSFFASPINGLAMLIIFGLLGIMPFKMFFIPIMTKTLLQGLLALALVPFILKLLDKLKLINHEQDMEIHKTKRH